MTKKHRGPDEDQPPLYQPGRQRQSRVFYIAVEGEVTEVDYLGHLQRNFGEDLDFKIHILYSKNGLKPLEVVDRVIAEEAEEGAQKWALFDRDEHVDVPAAFEKAKQNEIKVAFSHPSLDLWLLLHFAGFDSGAQSGSSEVVKEKLRKFPGFADYDKSGDRPRKHVRGPRSDALLGKEAAATRNAKRLTNDCPTQDCTAKNGHADYCPPLKRDPSTDVWKLLAELKIVSG